MVQTQTFKKHIHEGSIPNQHLNAFLIRVKDRKSATQDLSHYGSDLWLMTQSGSEPAGRNQNEVDDEYHPLSLLCGLTFGLDGAGFASHWGGSTFSRILKARFSDGIPSKLSEHFMTPEMRSTNSSNCSTVTYILRFCNQSFLQIFCLSSLSAALAKPRWPRLDRKSITSEMPGIRLCERWANR